MNTKKIYNEVIKHFEKQDLTRTLFFKSDDYTYLSLDGFVLYKIPTAGFPFDSEVVFGNCVKSDEKVMEGFFNTKGYEPAKVTFMEHIQNQGKKVLVTKIENKKNHTWINDKLKDCFDKNCEFMISSKWCDPVHVYENGEQVGIILPIRRTEEG